MRGRLLALGLLALVAAPAARAEDASGRTGLGLEFGYMKLLGGERDYSNVDQHASFDLRRGLSRRWSLELGFKYGWVRPGALPGEDAGFTLDSHEPLHTVIWQPRLGLLWHAAPDARVSPFLGLAAALTSWRVKDVRYEDGVGLNPGGTTVLGFDEDGQREELAGNDPTGTVTAGLDIWLSRDATLSLGARYHLFPGNKLDQSGYSDDYYFFGPDHVDANDAMVDAFAGLMLWFGTPDADGDGIADRDDRCPREREDRDGFQDSDGCPDPDNDGDGVLDRRDQCRDQAEDKDGWQDTDGCPDPDNDGDGVADADDRCPEAAEDKDGHEDGDGCPDPDNDGDSVLDAYDQCPDTPSGTAVDSKGCPLPQAAPAPVPVPVAPPVEEIRGDLILEGVNFVTGSADLTPASLEILQKVAHSLEAYPEVAIEIRGHTDSAGAAEANRDLSQRRALSVREYLVSLGISAARLTAVGYGEDYPIADNATPDGRARNRRVEIHRIR